MDSNRDQNNHNIGSVDDDVNQKLFQWFEKRGLLLELRAHMRQQMVKALQENITGLNSCRRKLSSSPKFQAMYMLIADFLLHQEHHYTVSVLFTEVPILNSLTEFSTYVADILKASKECTLPVSTSSPRFSSSDIQDILETLGLPPHTQAGAYAAELYKESGVALMTCIVRALSALYGVGTIQHNLASVNNQTSVAQESDESDEEIVEASSQEGEHWANEMREILLQSDVKIRHINKLQEKMKKFHQNEILRVREEEASKYEELCAQQEAEMELRLREEISKEFAEQQKVLEKQKDDLHSLALQLHAEHSEVTNRLSELQVQYDEVEDQKKQQEDESLLIEKLKNEVDLKQNQIEESYARLAIDQENFRKEQELLKSCPTKTRTDESEDEELQSMIKQCSDISKELEEAKEKLNDHGGVLVVRQSLCANSTQTLLEDQIDREQQTTFNSQPDPELIHQLQLERETINQMQEENIELQAYVLQQRCRIDDLTHRATTLAAQLEEAQQSIARHECQERVIAIPPSPVIPPRTQPSLMHSYVNWHPQRTGAGEESFFTPRHIPQEISNRHEARRRPLKFNCRQDSSSISEDSSPTDQILQETRRRLRNLEEQSAAVNRSYREFQSRQLEESNTLILQRNTANNHVNRVTNYFSSAPVPTQIPIRRAPAFNHPRLHTQIPVSDDSDDEDLNMISSRRSTTLFNRPRNTTNRLFMPPENPLLSRKLYFTNLKHFPKYTNFKKKYGKSPMRKTPVENKPSEASSSVKEHSSNQNECLEINPLRTENQACQTSFKFFIDKESSLESSSDSDTSFDKSETVKYRTSKSISKELKHYNKIKPRDGGSNCLKFNVKSTNEPKINYGDKSKEYEQKEIECQLQTTVSKIVMNPLSSAISSGSHAAESLPKDDLKKDETLEDEKSELVDCSNILVPSVNNPTDLYETEEIVVFDQSKPNDTESCLVSEHGNPVHLNEPLPLTAPNLRLLDKDKTERNTLQDLKEESPIAVSESAVVLSVTSGSDIFQELEVSQSEHSEDVISAPLEDLSKHSSDFWE